MHPLKGILSTLNIPKIPITCALIPVTSNAGLPKISHFDVVGSTTEIFSGSSDSEIMSPLAKAISSD